MKHYHNTTNISDPKKLNVYIRLAVNQDDKVLEFFINNPGREFTAEDVHEYVMPEAPLTSARRAISNLQKEGKLVSSQQVIGKYGRPIYTWKMP